MVIVRDKTPKLRIVRAKRAPAVDIQDEQPKKTADSGRKLMRWDCKIDITGKGATTFREIKEGDRIVDYQDVKISGYLSTWGNMDRDGETVNRGAFRDTIADFMKNPVMLCDHRNSVSFQCGSFQTVREDDKGLWVEGMVTNSPEMRHTRFLVAEKHLKTMSMGGLFYYSEGGREIFKVTLFEGTLTPIPANPKAIFSVRSLTEHEKKWLRTIAPPG